MYGIYEAGVLIATTQYPNWQIYNEKVESFSCTDEEHARAILVDIEEEDSFYANIEGREGYSSLERTVRVVKID